MKRSRTVLVDFCGRRRCPFRLVSRCLHEKDICLLSDEIDFDEKQAMLPNKCPLRSQNIVIEFESIHSKNTFANLCLKGKSRYALQGNKT